MPTLLESIWFKGSADVDACDGKQGTMMDPRCLMFCMFSTNCMCCCQTGMQAGAYVLSVKRALQ